MLIVVIVISTQSVVVACRDLIRVILEAYCTEPPARLAPRSQRLCNVPSPDGGRRRRAQQIVPVASRNFPTAIRIGPVRHAYNYTMHELHPEGPVYRCSRGSDWCNDGERLFLFQGEDGSGPWLSWVTVLRSGC